MGWTIFPELKRTCWHVGWFVRSKSICLKQVSYAHHYQHIQSHCSDVIMNTTASQITGLKIVYSTVYSGTDQRKHQSSASLAFVRGIHRGPVNSPHKGSVTRKMFPFDDVIMNSNVACVKNSRWYHLESLSTLLALCGENHRSTVALVSSFMLAETNSWINKQSR